MARRIADLGDAWEREDGGPDQQGLERELDWVLDDSIQALRPGPDAAWEDTSWRMLEPAARAAAHRRQDTAGWRLRLRAPTAQLWEWWERRLRDRVPFQYLISSAHWHTYVLAVGPGVLIPRPETEIFPDLVGAALAERPGLAALPWADLGTGSGAIAVAAADVLRRHNPDAEVWAVDLSPVAAAYARFNADTALGPDLGPRHVRVAVGSWLEPLSPLLSSGRRLGGLLSNPPYIPRDQMPGLQAEVGRHEPAGALDGGAGPGLDSLAVIVAGAAGALAPGGLIALETAGGEQADLVAGLLRAATRPAGAAGAGGGRVDGSSSAGAGHPSSAPGAAPQGAAGGEAGQGNAAAAGDTGSGAGSGAAAFERVEVLEDCYGVRRFVRAYAAGGD